MTKRIQGEVLCLLSNVFPVSFAWDCFIQVDAPQCVGETFFEILTAIYVKIAIFRNASREVAPSLRQGTSG
jgi:hypothetical protein